MNTKDLKFEGVSQNLKYIFTNKGIIQTGNYFNNKGKNIEYSFENLPFAIDILKEHKETYYKLNKISLTEYANSSRRFLYEVMDILQLPQQTTIIKEWENHFGDKLLLLNESVDKLLVESRIQESWNAIKYIIMEAWYNPFSWDWKGAAKNVGDWTKKQVKGVVDWHKEQAKQIRDKGLIGWGKDKITNIYNSVKNAVVSAWNCLTNNFVECLMEGIRSAAFSALGMGALVAIQVAIPGVGNVPDLIIFGSLLIWDVYKMLSGKYESGEYKWSWGDIIVDAVCLALPALGWVLKGLLRGVKTLPQIIAKAGKNSVLGKAVNAAAKNIGKIGDAIRSAAAWIGEKLGIKWLSKLGAKAEETTAKGVAELEKSVAKADTAVVKGETEATKGFLATTKEGMIQGGKDFRQFLKDGKLLNPIPYVLKQGGKTVLITAAFCAALGLDGWTCAHKASEGELTEDELTKAQEAIESDSFKDTLNTASVEDAEAAGLF